MPWEKDPQKCPDEEYTMYCNQYQAKPAMKKKCFRNSFVMEYMDAMTEGLSAEQKQQVIKQWDMCNTTDKLEAFRLHYTDFFKREKGDEEEDPTKYLKKKESLKPVAATLQTPYVTPNKRVELLMARALSNLDAGKVKQRQNDIKRLTQRGVPKLTMADLASNDPDINIFPERLSLSLGKKNKTRKLNSLPTKKELNAMSVSSSLFRKAPSPASPTTTPAPSPAPTPAPTPSPALVKEVTLSHIPHASLSHKPHASLSHTSLSHIPHASRVPTKNSVWRAPIKAVSAKPFKIPAPNIAVRENKTVKLRRDKFLKDQQAALLKKLGIRKGGGGGRRRRTRKNKKSRRIK
jgi:hypothetical protein